MASFLSPNGEEQQWHDAGAATGRLGPPPGASISQDDIRAIEGTVERSVIPSLRSIDQLRFGGTRVHRKPTPRLAEESVIVFADLATHCDVDASLKYIETMLAGGVPIESVYLDLIAPAAKYLGELWVEDRCNFSQVTLGVSCMQRAMRTLSSSFESERSLCGDKTALVLTMPGDQHTFGPNMAAEFLRRYGWFVVTASPRSADDAMTSVRSQEFDMIGFSVACPDALPSLTGLVADARSAALRQDTAIMVGGGVAAEYAETMRESGSDAVAFDGRDTVLYANSFVKNRSN